MSFKQNFLLNKMQMKKSFELKYYRLPIKEKEVTS